ncbi:MAG: hypothetical protein ACLQU4_02630 [Limisphaerales bacterium]
MRTLFCEQHGCSLSEFDKLAFQKCLYPHARLMAPLLRRIKSDYFERDLLFAHYFGNAKDLQEATAEIAALRYEDHIQPRFARNALRLRVSGRKANDLALKFFAQANPAQMPEQKPQPVRQASGFGP